MCVSGGGVRNSCFVKLTVLYMYMLPKREDKFLKILFSIDLCKFKKNVCCETKWRRGWGERDPLCPPSRCHLPGLILISAFKQRGNYFRFNFNEILISTITWPIPFLILKKKCHACRILFCHSDIIEIVRFFKPQVWLWTSLLWTRWQHFKILFMLLFLSVPTFNGFV